MAIIRLRSLFVLLLLSTSLVSCLNGRKVMQENLYFREITDSVLANQTLAFNQPFQPGDILSIQVSTSNEKMAALTNQGTISGGGSSGAGEGAGLSGYLVDNEGRITFPLLGKINVMGLTKGALTDTITERLRYYVDSPIVQIRLQNYKITILGEVAKPGTYSIPNERITILDAIGLAGDITFFGRRDSVRVVRTNYSGKIETGTLNINKGNIFNSPYYFLQQNDVVYVKMNKRKLAANDQVALRNISLGIGILTAITVLIATLVK